MLFVLSFSLGAISFYFSNKAAVSQRIDQTIELRYAELETLYGEFGLEQLIQVIKTRTADPLNFNTDYRLSSSDGEHLAGNENSFSAPEGWYDISGRDLGLNNESEYRYLVTNIDGFKISFGRSKDILKVILDTFSGVFLRTLVLSALLALIIGIYLAARSALRIRSLSVSLDRVANGDLDARLPISSRGDDIDNMAASMNGALSLLKQQVESMKQVTNNIAHDLRTPLNRLIIDIEEAIALEESGQRTHERLDEAREEAAQINSTFQALLRIAQIEAGARKSRFRRLDLLPILEKVVEIYDPVAQDYQQALKLDLNQQSSSNKSIWIDGDEDLLLQMIVNLVENSIHHCPVDSVIVVSARMLPSNRALVSICDNGPGVPAEQRDSVFERLYRLEASRTTKGSGLGLSLVKAVVELHEGSIELRDNEPGATKPGLCVAISIDSAAHKGS